MEKSLVLVILVGCISSGLALQCFHCYGEDNNHHGCIRDTHTCSEYQDACTTYIRWSVPNNRDVRGDRAFFVSKGCDTRIGCKQRVASLQTHCMRDWYKDWACVECCEGDLCNYDAWLSSAGSLKAGVVTIVTAAILVLVQRHL